LAALDRPTIAAVNGPAAAGGAGLTCVCDIVLAADHATLSYPGVPQGLVAGVVVPGLVRRVGDLAARALLLTGRPIDAAEAQRIGLVTEVVPAAALAERAAGLAAELAALPAEALAETKRLLGAAASGAAAGPLRLTAAARAALTRYRGAGGP
jgi:Enoyl-CoA hydratase/carnithine racemase